MEADHSSDPATWGNPSSINHSSDPYTGETSWTSATLQIPILGRHHGRRLLFRSHNLGESLKYQPLFRSLHREGTMDLSHSSDPYTGEISRMPATLQIPQLGGIPQVSTTLQIPTQGRNHGRRPLFRSRNLGKSLKY
jgi:hypothetical protein